MREGEGERCTGSHRPLGPDRTSVPMDDPLDGRQSDAGAGEVPLVVKPLERPEQLPGERRVEPGPVVPDEERRMQIKC